MITQKTFTQMFLIGCAFMKPLIALVVDDSILVRNTIKEGIKSCGGVAVFQAANGQDAVEVYKQHRPDIVFLDIVMPLRGGLEALVDIKSFDPDAKVIIVSGVATHSHVKRAIRAGATDFVQKPWEQSRLASIIEQAKQQRRG